MPRPIFHRLAALLGGHVAPDTGPRLAVTTHFSHDGWRGRAAARGHDFDLVAILQFVPQRHQPAIHLGADAGVAHWLCTA